ncbi:MAG: response regulator [Pseudomonadota bacterium]|nr:response regulator [Pseudomonadota bacterium]
MAKTILIVEENELNMKLFNDLLQGNGYDTIQSVETHNLVKVARSHMPDLITLNFCLPEASGLEIAKILKSDNELKKIPLIALTAQALEGDEVKFIDGGCDGYISKPISIPKFLETISSFLN